jgi:hypothetical protein
MILASLVVLNLLSWLSYFGMTLLSDAPNAWRIMLSSVVIIACGIWLWGVVRWSRRCDAS